MKKIKILYLITGLSPGGAELTLKNIILSLDQDLFSISICSITDVKDILPLIYHKVDNIYFLEANKTIHFLKAIMRLRKIIKNETPDILHCFMFHSNIIGRLAAIGFKCKTISSVRTKLINNRIGNFIDYLTQKYVDLYIVNSKTLYKFVNDYGINKNKLILVENGIDFNKLKADKSTAEIKKSLGIPNVPVITMVANFKKQKDYPTMIKALAYLKKEINFLFLALGTGLKFEDETSRVKKLVSKLNLDNVRLLGFRKDVPNILSITDIWVSSTLFEGQSNSLLEAMAMKIPIITTNIDENVEIVRNNIEALLVPPKNPIELAAKMKKLILDKNLSRSLIEKAYIRVKKKYDQKTQIEKIVNIYNSIKSKNKNQIKICLISHFGYPLYNENSKGPFGGGAGVQLFLLVNEMMENRNMDISVLTGNYLNNKNKIEHFKNKIKIHKTLPIKKKLTNYVKGFILFFFTLNRIKPDIIIQRASSILTGFSAVYCKLFKKIFIYSISSDSNVTGRDENGWLGRIFKYGIDNANYIVAQSNEQVLKLNSYKKKKSHNVLIIKNGLEIKHSLKAKKRYILWVGRAVKVKRPEIFLKLAQRLPNEKFIMICYKENNNGYWRTILRKSTEILNLEFLEFVPFNKISEFFEEAEIFVNTSKYEGFPNTYLQAFKNRTPVISLNVNPDKIFTKNKIGFFCNDKFNIMEKNLKLLIGNPDLCKSISNKAYIYFKENHNIKKTINKWNNLIEHVIRK